MNIKTCKAALTIGLFCLPALTTIAHSEVTPGQFNLMMTAAQKDGGKDFDILIELLIATFPEDEVEIRKIAAEIREANMPPPIAEPVVVVPAPASSPAPAPSPVDGTIFSDRGSEIFSNLFLPGWDKEIELNLLYTTGNTAQKSFGSATKFERDDGDIHQTATSYFDFNTSDGLTNKRRYGIAYKADYSLNERSYVTGFSSFEGDSFGAFNKRFTVSAGYGFKVMDNDRYQWSVEAGPALLMTKIENTEPYVSDIAGFANSLFTWVINERSELENETKFYMGNKMIIESKTDYKIKVSGALSGKLSFDVLYNRDAPIGREKTDLITRVGLLYDF